MIFINDELCNGCRSCVDACPRSALGVSKARKKANVNLAICVSCGTCIDVCPEWAIDCLDNDQSGLAIDMPV